MAPNIFRDANFFQYNAGEMGILPKYPQNQSINLSFDFPRSYVLSIILLPWMHFIAFSFHNKVFTFFYLWNAFILEVVHFILKSVQLYGKPIRLLKKYHYKTFESWDFRKLCLTALFISGLQVTIRVCTSLVDTENRCSLV